MSLMYPFSMFHISVFLALFSDYRDCDSKILDLVVYCLFEIVTILSRFDQFEYETFFY